MEKKVDVMLWSVDRYLREREREFGYLLKPGDNIREGGYEESCTYHGSLVKSLRYALSRFTAPCPIHIFSPDRWLTDMISTNLSNWARDSFLKPNGEPIKFQQDWMYIWIKLQEHPYEITTAEML